MNRLRPARPWTPILACAAVVLVWWVIAHNSGSGWVQLVGDAVFGIVVVGVFGPAIALSRTQLRLISVPSDGSAGLPLVVQLEISNRVRVRPIEPPGPETLIGGTGRNKSDDKDLTLLPISRGLHPTLQIEIASAAPFGLQWWRRRAVVLVPSPIHVAPRKGQAVPLPQLNADETGDRAIPLVAQIGDARSVRHYMPGDQQRRVHWLSTAHSGRLMVREMEQPSAQPVTIKVLLPNDEEAAERTAERALGTAVAVLGLGTPLVMVTHEKGGPVVGPVADRREAGRRLARAVPSNIQSSIELLG